MDSFSFLTCIGGLWRVWKETGFGWNPHVKILFLRIVEPETTRI
jgi:hypothetical protein